MSAFAAVFCALHGRATAKKVLIQCQIATKKTLHPSAVPTHSPQGEGKGADETFALIQNNFEGCKTLRF